MSCLLSDLEGLYYKNIRTDIPVMTAGVKRLTIMCLVREPDAGNLQAVNLIC